MYYCVSSTHVLWKGVAVSLDWPAHWTLIGRRARQSSSEVAPVIQQIMKQQWVFSIISGTHLDVYMASTWRPMSLALFSFVFLQISSSYEQLSAFVEGRWVNYFEITSQRRGILCFTFIPMVKPEETKTVYWKKLYAFIKHLCVRDKLVLASFVHPSCTLCLHWDSTEGLLQWNTRENPSASVYRANPYLLLKLEAEMCVLDKMRAGWDAGMIRITEGMSGMWSILLISYHASIDSMKY